MVLPGGSDISHGKEFEEKNALWHLVFKSYKASVKKPAGSKCLCNSGLGMSVLVCRKTKLV